MLIPKRTPVLSDAASAQPESPRLRRCSFSLAMVLALVWLALSGHYTPLLLGLGGLSVLLVVVMARAMGIVDHESQPLSVLRGIVPYHLWLMRQLVLSNIDVARRVWRGAGSLEPVVGDIHLSQHSVLARVIHANSITLTPGTVVIGLEGSRATVHALTPTHLDELRAGEMDRRVTRLEGLD